MIKPLIVELDMKVADQVVIAWLKDNMELIKGVYYGAIDDLHEDNEDYQAMKRILDYMMGPNQ